MSSTADTSHAALLKRKQGRIIASNLNNNPVNPSSSVGVVDNTTLAAVRVGKMKYTIRPELGPAIVEDPCCPSSQIR